MIFYLRQELFRNLIISFHQIVMTGHNNLAYTSSQYFSVSVWTVQVLNYHSATCALIPYTAIIGKDTINTHIQNAMYCASCDMMFHGVRMLINFLQPVQLSLKLSDIYTIL